MEARSQEFFAARDLDTIHEYYLPETVEEAVDRLIADLPFEDKNTIADLEEHELPFLSATILGVYIQREFWLGSGNTALMDSCCYNAGANDLHVYDASAIIIEELWKKLRKTHALRDVH